MMKMTPANLCRARLLAALLAVLCLDSCGIFRGRDPIVKPPKPEAVSLGDFRFAPGTGVFLEVFDGGKSIIAADLSVGADGELLVPSVGAISVAGMSPLSAAKKVEFLARSSGQNHLNGPRVHIRALDRRAVVHVSGHVRLPGPVTFHPGLSVAEAVAAAGGTTEDANRGTVSLASEGRSSIVTSLEAHALKEGDVVNVPRQL